MAEVTAQGIPKCSSPPRSCSVPPLAFVPTDDQWPLVTAAAGARTEVKVTFEAGPPVIIKKVENA